MEELNKIANDIFISASQKKPQLGYTSPTVLNKEYPFLKRNLFLISHKEAMEIINKLRCFYEINTQQDIKVINQRIQEIIEEIPL